ncbi:MAG: hypothetical protein A2945_00205 [Candidatus Liptonbacteria bacterium RIFCSPLOWO2_01_FULL_52_25]|uniref:Uncharacterized protein n=1 Tax=Candidatus Liptonbacteria bacterium RIFCSPLOWO2_01_FULL_52_25 TaxID=1798650 RepID=A0A1G2CFE1_9BACT|nr:MAG: hypothetical protein A2945_00205 [Candidatus Liptonbacteria bacterium RIFCSPLOWO2_01_FULL_52_25]
MKKNPENLPPEIHPDDPWHEEPPRIKPYRFGEKLDPKDKTKDYFLCPVCEERKKSVDIHTRPGMMLLKCRKGHQWIFDTKTNTIEDIERNLEFPE